MQEFIVRNDTRYGGSDASRSLHTSQFEYARVQLCVCPVEIQTPAHGNLNGRSVTARPLVLSPSSMLPTAAGRIALSLPQGKIRHACKKRYYIMFTFFCKLRISETGSVGKRVYCWWS